jgi:hypothetical protein
MSIFKTVGLASALAIGLGVVVVPTASRADTFTIFNDNIGVDCAAGCGIVTVTSSGTTYSFDVNLSSALVLHNAGGNSAPDAVAFNLTGVTASSPNTVVSAPTFSVPMDGYGTFLAGVNCAVTTSGGICSPNGISSLGNDLIFTITATAGQTLTGVGLDIAQASNQSNTGFAYASASGTDVVPLPAALPLFASGLGGLYLLGRRRKRKAAEAAFAV